MEKIRCCIIDDELHAAETLQWEIERVCPELEILAIITSPIAALESLREMQPDLIFLDIEMPEMNGFDLLKRLGDTTSGVIFTTAYDEFAIEAIRHSAIDYLLKPVDNTAIRAAVDRFIEKKSRRISENDIESLFHFLGQSKLGRVAIPTASGFEFYQPHEIIRCESDSNYCTVFFANQKKVVLSKTLKELEEILAPHGFIRVHHSHLVNGEQIKQFVRGEGGYIVLVDGTQLSVSRSKKDSFLSRFK